MRKLRKWLLPVASMALAGSTLSAMPAQAETNPACPSGVTQIGSTGHIVIGGATFASVKQFKGCGQNWGYVYVWQSWRNSHANWDMCASVVLDDGSGEVIGLKCAADTTRAELWSYGAYTLEFCTYALGWYGGRSPSTVVATGRSSTRC
jgi:hypothetical protein